MRSSLKNVVLALVAVIATASLVWFGSGLYPLWPLMWLAPLPVLLVASRTSWWWALAAAISGWFLGSLNLWHYLKRVLDTPVGIALAICLGLSAIFAIAVLLQRALLLRQRYWAAVFAFPLFWAAAEFVISLVSVHGTGGSVAYTQLNFLPVLQLASVTGPWGITFVLMLLSSTIAVSLYLRPSSPRRAARIAATGIGIIVLVVAFGVLRLERSTARETVTVGLIASDPPVSPRVAEPGTAMTQLLNGYAAQAAKLTAAGAQVIVLPEKIGVADGADLGSVDAQWQRLADSGGVQVVVGMIRKQGTLRYNEARWYSPTASERSYDKEHMLPPFESNLTPGTALQTLAGRAGDIGLAICKDMDFVSPARDYGRRGVGLMLVPAWDFDDDRVMHGHMAIMRGVEDGFAIARAARMGYLTVSDNRGRILAEITSDSAPFATLLAAVPSAHQPTVFLTLGDWFGWTSIVALLVVVGSGFGIPRAAVPEKHPSAGQHGAT
jgi:apolipoprotein N-acyltransferase